MRIAIYAAFIAVIPTILQAQLLNGDVRFPLLNQIRWDMSKEKVVNVCFANKANIGGNDTLITFEAKYFGVDAKTFIRFNNKAQRPSGIEVKFKELSEKLLDTLVSHFTRTTGESPVRAEKEKSLLLITVRIEVAMWKTGTEKIRLVIGRRNMSIFDLNLSFDPATR